MRKWIFGLVAFLLVFGAVAPSGSAQAAIDGSSYGCSGFYDNVIDWTVTPGVQGNGQRNIIIGTDGDDQINGGAGNDCIIGNGGADHLNGGAGNDILVGGSGSSMNGGSGIDRCSGGGSESSCEG